MGANSRAKSSGGTPGPRLACEAASSIGSNCTALKAPAISAIHIPTPAQRINAVSVRVADSLRESVERMPLAEQAAHFPSPADKVADSLRESVERMPLAERAAHFPSPADSRAVPSVHAAANKAE